MAHNTTTRAPQPTRRRAFTLAYRLRNGTAGTLTTLADCSCSAITQAIDLFGEQLRSCSARPGLTGGAA